MKDPNWSVEEFKEFFHYDPETGILTRIKRTGNNWKPGPVLPGPRDKYVGFRWRGVLCRVHRAAWLYMTGEWPDGEVDHRDRNSLNNAWSNLRVASRSQNGFNKAVQDRNTSGLKNIFLTPNGTFQVRIRAFGSEVTKTFKTLAEAEIFAERVRSTLHGEFTRHR